MASHTDYSGKHQSATSKLNSALKFDKIATTETFTKKGENGEYLYQHL